MDIRFAALVMTVVGACSPVGSEQPADASESAVHTDWSGEPSERAIERWTATHGTPNHVCADYARSVRIEWMDDVAKLDAACGMTHILGCSTVVNGDPVAYVRGDALQATLVHEVMHALSACQLGNSDAGHADASVWQGLMYNGTM